MVPHRTVLPSAELRSLTHCNSEEKKGHDLTTTTPVLAKRLSSLLLDGDQTERLMLMGTSKGNLKLFLSVIGGTMNRTAESGVLRRFSLRAFPVQFPFTVLFIVVVVMI